MLNKIIINNKEYIYDIKYKKMKSIILRIRDGQIIISAPYNVSIKEIETLIYKNQEEIINRINNYKPYVEYKDNGQIIIFNQTYQIKVRDMKTNKCVIHGNNLYVYQSNIEKAIDHYLYLTLKEYIDQRMDYYLKYHFHLDKPDIQYKHYKSRWGCCFCKENKIFFNFCLVHLDKKLIDYVIVHELCHFLEPNHSKKFYHEVEKRMPDYKDAIARFKEVHIHT